MGPLKQYPVTVNGIDTVLSLSDRDAQRRGLLKVDQADDAPDVRPVTPPAKKVTAPNKARQQPPNK